MAPDGLRATCLRKSGGAEAWDLDDPDESTVQYAGGSQPPLDVAYHPVLPLAACAGPGLPMIFDRESGKPQPDILACPAADVQGATIRRLWFSADGKGLLLDMKTASGDRCLYRAELKLSPADLEKVRRRLANMASLGDELLADHVPEPGHGTVPLSEIDAFQGGHSREMSAKEIGHAFTDAVVVVKNSRGSGTGFVVGKSGYILTCAHCARPAEGIVASYRSHDGNEVAMKSAPAEVLYADNRKDVALLKINVAVPLPPVRLAIGENVESGEQVTIIGNPGLGRTILEYTMTEGIVSNPRRKLGRQVLVQTSAAVNPGSSGAPMFGGNGMVIGLVAAKGDIENAGFAVPAAEVGRFLATAVNGAGSAGAIQRRWLDASGEHQMNAQYLGVRDGAVQLRRTDGKEIAVPLTKLSPQDQAFVRLLRPDAVSQ